MVMNVVHIGCLQAKIITANVHCYLLYTHGIRSWLLLLVIKPLSRGRRTREATVGGVDVSRKRERENLDCLWREGGGGAFGGTAVEPRRGRRSRCWSDEHHAGGRWWVVTQVVVVPTRLLVVHLLEAVRLQRQAPGRYTRTARARPGGWTDGRRDRMDFDLDCS